MPIVKTLTLVLECDTQAEYDSLEGGVAARESEGMAVTQEPEALKVTIVRVD